MELLNDHIAIFQNVLSDDFCEDIINWFEELDQEVIKNPTEKSLKDFNGGMRDGRGPNGQGSRKDISYFANFENARFCSKLRGAINDCAKEYITEYPNLGSYHLSNTQLKVQKTPPHGGYHIWHHEHSYESMARILVWTAYLNDIPEGEGETEFLYQGLKVSPKKGTVCLFPAAYTHLHRGNPPYSCDKYIATGWFYAQPT